MVQQLIKFKSKIITPAMELIIDEFHGKLSRRDLAHKIGVNPSTLKNYLSKTGMAKEHPGAYEKPYLDKKVTIVLKGVPRRNYKQAFKAAEKAVKIFRK